MTRAAIKERPSAEVLKDAMSLTVDREELLRALGYAAAIVERRNTVPILSNVLIETTRDALKLTSTDLNMQIVLSVPAKVEAEGATTVSATLLHGIFRELPDGSIELAIDQDGRLRVIGARSRYRLQTLSRDEFPQLRHDEPTCELVLPTKDLLRALASVSFAMDTETLVRPYCCGINLEAHGRELTLVAMDGKRIAWATLPADNVDLGQAILSAKVIATLSKLLTGEDGDVRLIFDARKATITVGSAVLTAKLVEGRFPPWRRIIPEGSGKRLLIVSAASFEGAVRRVSRVANERLRAIKLELSEDKLTISCTSMEYGAAIEEVPCIWEGGELTIGFNARFLLDLLAASNADELHIEFNECATAPAFITNPNDASAKWLLAPMRV